MAEETVAAYRSRCIENNRREYGERYAQLTFPDPATAAAATTRRTELLAALDGRVGIGCGGTKLDMSRLSPGCRLCVEGAWSCLFINGRCNASCFYCPTSQDEIGLPTTNSVNFRDPADYLAYLDRFGFRGASLSGGEPLLTPGRTLGFLGALKRRFGGQLHTWIYTNGSLVDRDLLLKLRDAGLDEIRFDIGAINYSLKPAALAVGIIPTVTVEIPAVPEELARMKTAMGQLADAGVRHLNLHQLRLTPYSLARFAGRPYTYLHGEKVTVLESELTALELIRHGLDARIDLPVNYCSFVYKNRYQKQAARRRGALAMAKPHEALTEAGLLRALHLHGPPEALSAQADAFAFAGAAPTLWQHNPARGRLTFAVELWPLVDFTPFSLKVAYAEAGIRENVSYRNPFTEVKFPSGRKVAVERWDLGEYLLEGGEIDRFYARFQTVDGRGIDRLAGGDWAAIRACEELATGLADYF